MKEYKFVTKELNSIFVEQALEIDKWLNQYAKEGWTLSLLQLVPHQAGIYAVFERSGSSLPLPKNSPHPVELPYWADPKMLVDEVSEKKGSLNLDRCRELCLEFGK